MENIIIACSLCADCFAVCLASSICLKMCTWKKALGIAIIFGIIQAGLLFAGWGGAAIFASFVEKWSKWIAFALLAYVGGNMLLEGIKGESEGADLNSFKSVIIGGIATSIDALAVGVSRALSGADLHNAISLTVAVGLVTVAFVFSGIQLGHRIGKAAGEKAGRWAQIAGGAVLLTIGILICIR